MIKLIVKLFYKFKKKILSEVILFGDGIFFIYTETDINKQIKKIDDIKKNRK